MDRWFYISERGYREFRTKRERMQESGRLVLSKACWRGGLADVSLSSKTGNWSAGADLPPKKTQRAITTANIKVVEKNVTAFCASHLPAFFTGAGSLC
jgi:hypothetical protein